MRREAAAQGVSVVVAQPGGIRTRLVEDQLARVQSHLAALPPDQQARYGSLYRGYETMAAHAHRTASMEPEAVAPGDHRGIGLRKTGCALLGRGRCDASISRRPRAKR
jgi:hypothetical protein